MGSTPVLCIEDFRQCIRDRPELTRSNSAFCIYVFRMMHSVNRDYFLK
jgi:hypothetical protein